MNIYVIAIGCIICGLGLGYLIHKRSVADEMKFNADRLDWFRKNFFIEKGSTIFNHIGNYELVSVNGGKNWIALSDSGVALGDAETVHPGLLSHIEGFKALVKHAKEKGPIDLSDPEGIEVLTRAGFEVKTVT